MDQTIKERVKELFITSDRSVYSISKECGVQPATGHKWRVCGGWDEERNTWRKEHGLEPIESGQKRYSWAVLKSDYAATNMTYREVAEKYGMAREAVKARGLRDGWKWARLEFRKKLGDTAAAEALAKRRQVVRTRDWDAIRSEYITGLVTMAQLAKKHGICYNTLTGRARREDWTGQRKETQKRMADQATEQIIAGQAKEISRLIPAVKLSTDLLLKSCRKMKKEDEVRPKELAQLIHALRNLEAVDRVLSGRLTPSEQLRRDEMRNGDGAENMRIEFASDIEELAK